MRSVFSSESVKVVQFGTGGPPGRAEGWRAVTRVLRSCATLLRDDSITTFLPDDCSLCSAPMTAWSNAPVCDACIDRIEPQQGALCTVCGEALGLESARFASSLGMSACTQCRLAPPAFTRAVAYAAYEDELREMLHLLKYRGTLRLAGSPLGPWLAQAIAELRATAADEMTVVAVPLFAERRRRRGFNQSVVLAEAAVALLRRSHPEWKLTEAHEALVRTRDTDEQFSLNPQQRRRNLQGAFRVGDEAAIRGRQVLLVDDILTTGATARECSRVLRRAGASAVFVVTLARAQAEASGEGARRQDVAMWSAIEPDPQKRQGFLSAS